MKEVCTLILVTLLAVQYAAAEPGQDKVQEAQPCSRAYGRAVGMLFSFSEFSASYQTLRREDELLRLSLNLDMAGVIPGDTGIPGVSAGFTYLYVFARKHYPSGESLMFYAGPGACAGYVRSSGGSYGFMAALSGCVGLEYLFCVPVSISLTLEPRLGIHARQSGNDMSAGFYMGGLVSSLYPHIGLKYLF